MSILLFDQWDKLVSLLQKMAGVAVAEKSQYALNRVIPEGGHAQLKDRAMNNLTLNGEEVTLQVPDIIPGKARDFLVRVTAEVDTELSFSGAEKFESDNQDFFMPPNAGETVIYFFTETDADVFLVSRRIVSQIESE